MMKKRTGYLIIVFFIFINFNAKTYALNMNLTAPQEIDENNIEKIESAGTNKKIKPIIRPNVEYKAQGLRNPFEQPVLKSEVDKTNENLEPKVEARLPNLTVQGVIWGDNLPQAIINNKVVKVGDRLGSVDVIDISKEGVTVLFASVKHKLSTLPVISKQ